MEIYIDRGVLGVRFFTYIVNNKFRMERGNTEEDLRMVLLMLKPRGMINPLILE